MWFVQHFRAKKWLHCVIILPSSCTQNNSRFTFIWCENHYWNDYSFFVVWNWRRSETTHSTHKRLSCKCKRRSKSFWNRFTSTKNVCYYGCFYVVELSWMMAVYFKTLLLFVLLLIIEKIIKMIWTKKKKKKKINHPLCLEQFKVNLWWNNYKSNFLLPFFLCKCEKEHFPINYYLILILLILKMFLYSHLIVRGFIYILKRNLEIKAIFQNIRVIYLFITSIIKINDT